MPQLVCPIGGHPSRTSEELKESLKTLDSLKSRAGDNGKRTGAQRSAVYYVGIHFVQGIVSEAKGILLHSVTTPVKENERGLRPRVT